MAVASSNDSNNFVIKQFSSSVFSPTRNAIFGAKSLELRLHTHLAIKHKVLKSYIFFDGLAKRGRERGFCISTSTETEACTILYVVLRKMINLNIYKWKNVSLIFSKVTRWRHLADANFSISFFILAPGVL